MSKPTPIAKLVAILMPEAFQSEDSAVNHCGRDADRLGNVPPGVAMRDIAEHARHVLPRLGELAQSRGMSRAQAATALGRAMSNARALAVDIAMSQEKSYRGTLLGLHHGISTVLLLEDAAVVTSDQVLADFCKSWLSERTRLVADVERELAWFAQHPDAALSRATPPFVKKISRTLPLLAALRPRAAQA
jgi:hypothetical protein